MSMRSLGHRKHNGLGVMAATAATVAVVVVAASTRGRSVDVGEPEVFLVVGMRRRLCWPRWPEWIDDGDRLVTAVQSHESSRKM